MLTVDILDDGGAPKRGDLIQTNVSTKRERTWIILKVHHMKRSPRTKRYKIMAARWWELEPDMRARLFRSAERNGGQKVLYFKRYPAKKKKTFEDLFR